MSLFLLASVALALEGHVVASDGSPMHGARVDLLVYEAFGTPRVLASTTAAEDGSFALPVETAPPDAFVIARMPGFPKAWLEMGNLPADATLRFSEPTTLRVAPEDDWPADRPPLRTVSMEPTFPSVALGPCGDGCVDVAVELEVRGQDRLVRWTGTLQPGETTCEVWTEGVGRARRCRKAADLTAVAREFQGLAAPFFERPPLLIGTEATHDGWSSTVAGCGLGFCNVVVRHYPEDEGLAALLAEAYVAAGARRAWPHPSP